MKKVIITRYRFKGIDEHSNALVEKLEGFNRSGVFTHDHGSCPTEQIHDTAVTAARAALRDAESEIREIEKKLEEIRKRHATLALVVGKKRTVIVV